MSISTTPVHQATGTGSSGSSVINVTITAPTNGNLIVAEVWYANTNVSVSSVSLTGNSATFVKAAASQTNHTVEIWYAENSQGGGTALQVQLSGNSTSNSIGANVSEWSGVATSSSLDAAGTGTNNGTSTTPSTASVTPASGNNILLIGGVRPTTAVSAGPSTGFTALTSPDGSSREFGAYQVVTSSSGSYQLSYTTTSGTFDGAIATFKAPSTGQTATAAGVATTTVTLNVKRAVPVSATGQAVTTASLTKGNGGSRATVTGQATTTLSGQVWTDVPMGAIAGVATITLSLTAQRQTARPVGVGTATVTLTKITGTTQTASAAGVGAVTLALHVKHAVTASASGTSSVTLVPQVLTLFTMGNIAGQAATSVSLSVKHLLTASATGQATTSATPGTSRSHSITASASGVASATTTLFVKRALVVTSAGLANATLGTPKIKHGLSVVVTGLGTVALSVGQRHATVATAHGVGTVSVTIGKVGANTATAAGISSVVLSLAVSRALHAAPSGTSTAAVTATVVHFHVISVAIAGQATSSAGYRVARSLVVSSAGIGTSTPSYEMRRTLQASAIGAATVVGGLQTTSASIAATVHGKYKPEHDSALIDLGNATGFGTEHASALHDLSDAGV